MVMFVMKGPIASRQLLKNAANLACCTILGGVSVGFMDGMWIELITLDVNNCSPNLVSTSSACVRQTMKDIVPHLTGIILQ